MSMFNFTFSSMLFWEGVLEVYFLQQWEEVQQDGKFKSLFILGLFFYSVLDKRETKI